jgi:hypothetical protein
MMTSQRRLVPASENVSRGNCAQPGTLPLREDKQGSGHVPSGLITLDARRPPLRAISGVQL